MDKKKQPLKSRLRNIRCRNSQKNLTHFNGFHFWHCHKILSTNEKRQISVWTIFGWWLKSLEFLFIHFHFGDEIEINRFWTVLKSISQLLVHFCSKMKEKCGARGACGAVWSGAVLRPHRTISKPLLPNFIGLGLKDA